MAILLDSDQIERLLTPKLCIEALEPVFAELGRGEAANMLGREVILSRLREKEVPGARTGHAYHGLEVQTGAAPRSRTASLRVKSDILYWPEVNGEYRRKKYPGASGGLFCGFVILFDSDTGEPTALMPDGLIQRMRVGATSALGAKYMARDDAEVAGIIGAGWQAEAQALTLAQVRKLREIRIFSPTPSSRETLAGRLNDELDASVVAVSSPEAAARDADIVHAATNSRAPVLKSDWLSPGSHASVISVQEIGEDVIRDSDALGTTRPYNPKQSNTAFADGFAEDVHEDEFGAGWWHNQSHWERMASLGDLINGHVAGRRTPNERTAFITKGAAVQFAAVGARLVAAAREAGVGQEIPTEWFLQPYQP